MRLRYTKHNGANLLCVIVKEIKDKAEVLLSTGEFITVPKDNLTNCVWTRKNETAELMNHLIEFIADYNMQYDISDDYNLTILLKGDKE